MQGTWYSLLPLFLLSSLHLSALSQIGSRWTEPDTKWNRLIKCLCQLCQLMSRWILYTQYSRPTYSCTLWAFWRTPSGVPQTWYVPESKGCYTLFFHRFKFGLLLETVWGVLVVKTIDWAVDSISFDNMNILVTFYSYIEFSSRHICTFSTSFSICTGLHQSYWQWWWWYKQGGVDI